MSAEAWIILGVAVAGYGVHFGILKGDVKSLKTSISGVKEDIENLLRSINGLSDTVTTIRENHLHNLADVLSKHRRTLFRILNRLNDLPCGSMRERVRKLEEKDE